MENHFEKLSTPDDVCHDENEKVNLAALQNNIIESLIIKQNEPIQTVNESEVYNAIKQLNSGKAADEEGISAEHFKCAQHELVSIVTDIMNTILNDLDVPAFLKSGVLTPMHKKGKDKFSPNNYRGIVVSNTLLKILEGILKDRLDNIFDSQQNRLQRGFTAKSSSMNAAYVISETIEYHREQNKPLLLATLDAQKAFDTVNHEILFNKLYHMGVNGPFWLLLWNLYRDATVKEKWDNTLSDSFTLKQGTKQGAKLSTTLFKCYQNHRLDSISSSGLGANIRNISVSTLTCADDTALLANNVGELQAMLNIVEFNTRRDLVKINPDKSEIITYKCNEHVKVSFDNQIIETVNSIKHLGILRNVRNSVDIENRIQTASRTVYSLLGPGLHARQGLSPLVTVNIWNVYVIPRSLHGIEVLRYSKTDIQKLECYQRKILKHLQGLAERIASAAVYILVGAQPIETVIERNNLSLFLNIARLVGSVEHDILRRQLAMADPDGQSFTSETRRILQKYNLPDPETLLSTPPGKEAWKSMLRTALDNYWTSRWHDECIQKSSLRYIQIQDSPINTAHNVWTSIQPRCQKVQRAEVKARLLTGTYILQSNTAKFNQNEVSATCKMCCKGDEKITHFLLQCTALTEATSDYIQKIVRISGIAPSLNTSVEKTS